MRKGITGDVSFYLKCWVELTALERNDRFSIYFRPHSASTVTPSKKVQLTLIESPLRAFQWAQDRHRTLSVPPIPQGWLKNAVSKIWTVICDNSETVRDRMSFMLITNRKSHKAFRLIPTSMTLNDLELRNSDYFAFFHRMRFLRWPITSQWLKTDLWCP